MDSTHEVLASLLAALHTILLLAILACSTARRGMAAIHDRYMTACTLCINGIRVKLDMYKLLENVGCKGSIHCTV